MIRNYKPRSAFSACLSSTDLTIERFCMTGGKSPIGYLKAYLTNLYLSKDSQKVTEAIEEGKPASLPQNLGPVCDSYV